MKTVIIYDTCGEDSIKFFIVDGSFKNLNNKYIGLEGTSKKEEDQINSLIWNSTFDKMLYLKEFPVEAVKEGAEVIVLGCIP